MASRKSNINVLIVDDEVRMCKSLEMLLQSEGGFGVSIAHNAIEALQRLDRSVDVMITDLTMPGRDGMSLLKEAHERQPGVQVVMMTAYSTVQSAIEAMKFGAFEYLIKPFENEQFLTVVKRAGALRNQARQNRSTQKGIGSQEQYGELIGKSAVVHRLYYLMERAAQTESTVLITGESGTGKELVARAIHYNGLRKNGPFIVVNCTALSETLLESELFGHVRGAYTGAEQSRAGRFAVADGGTIFLDEIGELPASLQVKFLRVLQEKTFEAVGSTSSRKVDVRVVAATNRDLEQAVASGQFREDLFYRLKVLHMAVPPLRERKGDILLLADYFLAKKTKLTGAGPKTFSEEARRKLATYAYPGNVRELENMIERAIVLSTQTEIDVADLPDLSRRGRELGRPSATAMADLAPLEVQRMPLKNSWLKVAQMARGLEEKLLRRALREKQSFSHQQLADLLGTSRRVLELRLKEYGIAKSDFDRGKGGAGAKSFEAD